MRHDKTPFFLDFIGVFHGRYYLFKIKKISIVFSDVKIEFLKNKKYYFNIFLNKKTPLNTIFYQLSNGILVFQLLDTCWKYGLTFMNDAALI
jgi:hypothetical protein